MEQTVFSQKLANVAINGIIRFRIIWLIFVLVMTVVSGSGLRHLQMDSSNESFLPESDALSIANERFKEQFGNEAFVFILVESPSLITHETLSRIRELRLDLEERLPFVDEANTITNVEYTELIDDTLVVEDIIPDEIPSGKEALAQVRQKLASSPLYLNRIVSDDWQHAGVVVSFERIPETVWVEAAPGFSPMAQADWPKEKIVMSENIYYEKEEGRQLAKVVDPRKLITPALKAILEDHQKEDFKLLATGMPLGDFEVDRINAKEGARIGLIALAAAFLFMLVLYRNPVGVLAPVSVMITTVIILFGWMGWLSVPITMGSLFVAPLLMVLSVSYSIHYINHFRFYKDRKGERLRALHYAYAQAAWPCFLTAITTAIGFASFLVVSMKPIRDVGLACAAGTLISFILVMILVPVFYSFGKPDLSSSQPEKTARSPFPRGMVPLAREVLRRKGLIIGASVFLALFGAYFFRQIPVETDMLKILGEENAFVKDANTITQVLGGYYSYEVFIELQREEAAKEPEILSALDTLSVEAEKWGAVTSTMSLADMVKEIHSTMNYRNPGTYVIPDSREKIAQLLLLYEISGGKELDNWVDYGYQRLRLSVQMADSKDLEQHIAQMRSLATDLFPEDTQIRFVGDVPIMLRLMNLLTIGQVKSIALAFLVITVVMIAILRSVKAGLLSMIPNLFPLVVIAGVMGLFAINLDIMTIMIAPMIIGIAVDDTVHFFIHFRDEVKGFQDYEKANRQTFIKIGHALLFTTVVLSLGFGILGFSHVQGIAHMGLLAVTGIVMALLADFFIAPLLLVFLKPFGREPSKPQFCRR